MRLGRALRFSLIGLFALLATCIVLILTLNLGAFKGTAEGLVSDLLGREFTIGGEFKVHLGRRIHVVAENVKLANADWSSNEDFASIGRLEGTLDPWSLFNPPLLIESLSVEHVRLGLESSNSGENNWTFFPSEDAEEASDTSEEEKLKLPVMVVSASIVDFALTYANPQRLQPFQFNATQLRVSQTDTEDLNLDLIGDINETPLELTASAGRIDNLIDFSNVSFGVSGQLGEISFDGRAQIDDLLRPGRSTASLEIRGPNAEYLTNVLGLQRVTTGPLDLTATIEPAGEAMQVLLRGNFGEFTLDLNGQLANFSDLQDLDLHITASGPNANTVASLFGADSVPADPFSIVGKVARSGAAIDVDGFQVKVGVSQLEIDGHFANFPDPHGASATVRLSGPEIAYFSKILGLPGELTGPFKLDATLEPLAQGGTSIDLSATARDMRVTCVGNVTADPSFLGTRVEATFAGPNVRTLATAVGLADAPAKPFELKLALKRVAAGAELETATLFIADDRLSLQGLVGNKPLEADTDIQFQMTGPDFASTLVTFGLDAQELPYAQYKVSGSIVRETEYFVLHDVELAIGEKLDYTVVVDGQLSPRQNFEGSKLRIAASGASLGSVASAAGLKGMPGLPFAAAGVVEKMASGFTLEDGKVRVGDDTLEVQGLIGDEPLERDTNLRINAHLSDLKMTLKNFGFDYAALPRGELNASGELQNQDGKFAVKGLKASLAGASLSADGMLGGLPKLDGTTLLARVEGVDLSRLLPAEPRYAQLNKPYEISANVALEGDRLLLEELRVLVDKTQLTGNLDLALSPLFDSGHFVIDGSSPDVFSLAPTVPEMVDLERAPLDLHAQGKWADNLWILDKLLLQLGNGHVSASGTFDGPPDFDKTDLGFDLDIASIRNYSFLTGWELPAAPARLKFRLLGQGDTIEVEKFEGTVGDSDVTADFSFRAGNVPRIQLGFSSDRLNLAPYLQERTEEAAAQAETTAPEKDNSRVIPDIALPVDFLRKYEGSVDIKIAELNMRQRTLQDVALLGTLENAALLVKTFTFRSSYDEKMVGTIEIHPTEKSAEMLLAAQGNGFVLVLPKLTKDDLLASPRFDLDTVLHGSGATLRELAGSLDGYAHVHAGPGKIRQTALKFLTDDFLSTLLNTVNPFAKTDPYTNLKCGEVLLRLKGGIITGSPAYVTQTERLNVFAAAKIDLKTEKINVNVNTVPQKGLGLSFSDLINPYTNIGGTLAKPILTLDPGGAMIEGGAAVATAGLSILAKRFAERYLTAADACGKAASDAEPEFQAIRTFYLPAGAAAQ